MAEKIVEIPENETPDKLKNNEIFKDGLEGLAYIYIPETGQDIIQVSDETSNISLRGFRVICDWLIKMLLNDGFTKDECYQGIHGIIDDAFEEYFRTINK